MRDRIYTSALSLFAEHGHERTTIDQIPEHADVARGTFFNYFQRKEDLVTAWAEARKRRLELCREESMKSQNDDVTVHLERCMAALAEFNESEREVTAAMLQAWVKAGQATPRGALRGPGLRQRHRKPGASAGRSPSTSIR
ncbi:TetR/AcrR family transcriptional regulator [Streptomyces sp. NBC_01231]|nr:TetR/AcrR family transcriptional regulator [Streptomyces sp. NBC_01231]